MWSHNPGISTAQLPLENPTPGRHDRAPNGIETHAKGFRSSTGADHAAAIADQELSNRRPAGGWDLHPVGPRPHRTFVATTPVAVALATAHREGSTAPAARGVAPPLPEVRPRHSRVEVRSQPRYRGLNGAGCGGKTHGSWRCQPGRVARVPPTAVEF